MLGSANLGPSIFCCNFFGKKALLSQRWPRDAPYIYMDAMKNFGSPWLRPRLIFPKLLMTVVVIDRMKVHQMAHVGMGSEETLVNNCMLRLIQLTGNGVMKMSDWLTWRTPACWSTTSAWQLLTRHSRFTLDWNGLDWRAWSVRFYEPSEPSSWFYTSYHRQRSS